MSKERLLKIPLLNTNNEIAPLNSEAAWEVEKKLNEFIEQVPSRVQKIRAAAQERNFPELAKGVAEVCDALKAANVDAALAESFLPPLKRLGMLGHAVVEAYVLYFTSFIVSFADEAKRAEIQNTVKQIGPDGKRTILVVDDVTIFLNLLKQFLQDDYDLVCVNSGAAAMRYLQFNKPDLFLFDIEMPGMNGYELAKAVRDAGHKVPIIFITGNPSPDAVNKAIKVGAVDFVAKPVTKESVLEKIQKYI
jgi:CheY-like chemotaxis protein